MANRRQRQMCIRDRVLPDSIPNSEVKCRNADGSVGFPHVRVGHRRIELRNPELRDRLGVFAFLYFALGQLFIFKNRIEIY